MYELLVSGFAQALPLIGPYFKEIGPLKMCIRLPRTYELLAVRVVMLSSVRYHGHGVGALVACVVR